MARRYPCGGKTTGSSVGCQSIWWILVDFFSIKGLFFERQTDVPDIFNRVNVWHIQIEKMSGITLLAYNRVDKSAVGASSMSVVQFPLATNLQSTVDLTMDCGFDLGELDVSMQVTRAVLKLETEFCIRFKKLWLIYVALIGGGVKVKF